MAQITNFIMIAIGGHGGIYVNDLQDGQPVFIHSEL